jgi:hypothetical protein
MNNTGNENIDALHLVVTQKKAQKALDWMQSADGRHELSLVGDKWGFHDNWMIVHAIRKTSPLVTRYELITEIINEVRILRRTPAIEKRRASCVAVTQ